MLRIAVLIKKLVVTLAVFSMTACAHQNLVDSQPKSIAPKPRPESVLWYKTEVYSVKVDDQGIRICDIAETIEARSVGFRYSVINHHKHALVSDEVCSPNDLSTNHVYRELNVKYDDTDYWYETNIFQQAADRNYWRLNEWRNLGERYKTLDPYELIDAINQHQYEFDVLKPMILASSWMKSRRSKFENLAEWVRWSEHGGYKKTTIRGSNIVKVCSPLGVNWSNC